MTNTELESLAIASGGSVRGVNLDALTKPDEQTTEKEFQAAVIALAKRNGWRVYHTHDSRRSEKGFPDLVMVRCGRLIVAELKAESGRVAAEQANWLDDLREVKSVEACLWRPADWLMIVETLGVETNKCPTS